MKQKSIYIGDVDVPVIEDGGDEWFPISYIATKVLLRNGKGLISKSNKDKYSNYINQYIIKFGESNIQETNCISKEGLIKLLSNTQVGRLKIEQRKSQNKLHKYLGIDLLPVDEIDTDKYNYEWLNEHTYERMEIVLNEIFIKENVSFRRCSKCYKHYPMTGRFFAFDRRTDKGFTKVCHICTGKDNEFKFQHGVTKEMKQKVSNIILSTMKDSSLISVYNAYLQGKLKRLPDCYCNKESYLSVIKHLFNNGKITKDNLTSDILVNRYKLKNIDRFLTLHKIYEYLFGEKFYLKIWEYPCYKFSSLDLTYNIANEIVNEYIKEFDIAIDNIFDYDYESLFRKCRLRKLTNGNLKYFVVQYYDFNYPGYKFKINSNNYYKEDRNVLFDLKYLIEKDMKLDINKIPLYLTKLNLRKKCNPLYNFIVTKKNKSIYEWVNVLYPDQFIEADFEINTYRNEFDSDTEMYIHEILEKEFPNKVIYNQRNRGDIRLKGKIPDWFVFTDHGVYVVEYFGMLDDSDTENSRIKDYKRKYEEKIELYKELNGYKFLYFYPDDIKDDYKGVYEKIKYIKCN